MGRRIIGWSTVLVLGLAGLADAQTIGTWAGGGPAASLVEPSDIAFDAAGNAYILEPPSHTLRRIDAVTGAITTITPLPSFTFTPRAIAVDPLDGSVVFSNGDERIWRLDPGTLAVTPVAGTGVRTGSIDGPGGSPDDDLGDLSPAVSATFSAPGGLAFDVEGNLFVSDTNNNRIRRIDWLTETIRTVAGTGIDGWEPGGFRDGVATDAILNTPKALTFGPDGSLFIADESNFAVRRLMPALGERLITGQVGEIVSTLVSAGAPSGIAADRSGRVFYSVPAGHLVFLWNPGLYTYAGTGTPGSLGDGGPAMLAELSSPRGLALDATGNLYIADSGNNRIRVVTDDAVGPPPALPLLIELTGPEFAIEGDPVTYSLALRDTSGTGSLGPFTVRLDVSSGLALSAESSDGWRCVAGIAGRYACTWSAGLAPGDSTATHTLTFTVTPPYPTACGVAPSPCVAVSAASLGAASGRVVVFTGIRTLNAGVANQFPEAGPDTATAFGTNPVTIPVLDNDTDPDGERLTVTAIVTAPHAGEVVLNADGTITYTPHAATTGSDSFRYRVSDPSGASVTAVVTITLSSAPLTLTTSKTIVDIGNVAVGRMAAGRLWLDGTTTYNFDVQFEPATSLEIDAVVARGYSGPVSDPLAFRSIAGGSSADFSAMIPIYFRPTTGQVSVAHAVITVNRYTDPQIIPVTVVGRGANAGEVPVTAVDDPFQTNVGTPIQIDMLVNDVASSGRDLYLSSGSSCANLIEYVFDFAPCELAPGSVAYDFSLNRVVYTPAPGFIGTTGFGYSASEVECVGQPGCRYENTMYFATVKVTVTVPIPGGGTMVITVPPSQTLSNVAITPTTSTPPPGVTFPFWAISYKVTLGQGETSSTAMMVFTPRLPASLVLFKANNTGSALVQIPMCNGVAPDCWTRLDTATSTTTSTTIWLTLSDNGGFDLDPTAGVIEDPVLIGFETTNRPPKADAGPDKVVLFAAGASVQLDGSGSWDPFYQPITYAWTITAAPDGSAGTLLTGVRPLFTPGAPGTYEISLVVSDGQLDSAPDTVVIRVADAPTPLALNRVDINTTAGDQFDPHVDGDLASYSETSPAGVRRIRYYDFSTGVDAAIPNTLPDGSLATDLLSDAHDGRVAFTRISPSGASGHAMLFNPVTQELVEVNPQVDALRIGVAIGGATLAYSDLQPPTNGGDLVVIDLANGSAVTRLTNDTMADQNQAVSPDGRVVVWERCPAASLPYCDVYQATLGAGGWVVSPVGTTAGVRDGEPDTNGDIVVYQSNRGPAGDYDVFYRPVSGSGETHLQLPGEQLHPSVAGGVIVFWSRSSPTSDSDIFLYEITTNRIFQITATPNVNETLSDVAVLADGGLRLVWDADDEVGGLHNVYGATVYLSDLFLSAPAVPAGVYADGLHPDRGTASTLFTFKAVYTSRSNHAPWPASVKLCIDSVCDNMALDLSAAGSLQDGDYTNGEQYTYGTNFAVGTHTYYFEATDGVLSARWPVGSGAFSGPVVSDLALIFVSCNPPDPHVLCRPHFEVAGGIGSYSWNVSGLPAGATLDPVSGLASGPAGLYTVTVSVTDANGDVAEWTGPFAIGAVNHAPTADAGTDVMVDATSTAGALLTLTGTGSDPDGDALTFDWSGPCGSASTAAATFTCPLGTSVMTLTVTDGRGASAVDGVIVSVRVPFADLALTMTAVPATATVGQPVAVKAVVTNNGPSGATRVTLSGFEALTAAARGLSLFEALSAEVTASGTCVMPPTPGGVVTCSLGTIDAGASATVTITGTPTMSTSGGGVGPGAPSVSATVDAAEPDGMRGNNRDAASLVVNPLSTSADLTVTMSADAGTVTVGQPVTVTTVITNNGPDPATNVRLSGFRTLTAEGELGWAKFAPLFVAGSQGACSLPSDLGGYVTCSLGTLSVGASAAITLVATPTDLALPRSLGTGPGPIFRASRVTVGVGLDALRANEGGLATSGSLTQFTVVASPSSALTDLAVAAAAVPEIVVVGQEVTVTAVVTNNGPDFASLVRLSGFEQFTTDAWTSLSLSASQGSCSTPPLPGGYVTCSLGSLAAGASASVRMTAVPTEAVLPWIISATGSRRRSNSVHIVTFARAIDAGSGDDARDNSARTDLFVVRAGVVLPGSGDVTTPVGDDVSVALRDPILEPLPITLSFPSVTQAGVSTAWPILGGPQPPANFQVNGTAWDIITTAQYTPPVTICFSGGFLASSRILHYDESSPSCDLAQPATCWVELPNQQLLPAGSGPYNMICADTTTFSPFVVGEWVTGLPSADAGPAQVVEATGPAGAPVLFAGTGEDPKGGPLSFTWSGPCGVGAGESITLPCPLGTSAMTLTVASSRGLSAAASVTVTVRDTTPPSVAIAAPADGATYILNQTVNASFLCSDGGAGVATCTGSAATGASLDTSSVGTKSFTVTTTDAAGNQARASAAYSVIFAGSGPCLWNSGHQVLWPIEADGSSVFWQGLPVPARFRVCDANGRSIGSPGVVSSFRLVQTLSNGVTRTVDQAVPSALSPPLFRWDRLLQEWEFVINTRGYAKGTTYSFRVTLSDATVIDFRFALK